MQIVTAISEPTEVSEAQALRISFRTAAQPDETALLVVDAPLPVAAVSESIAPETALEVNGDNDDSLRVLWIPSSGSSALEFESAWAKIAEDNGRASGDPRIVRAGLRTSRVIWSEKRAVICCAQDQFEETLDAILRFTLAERQTVKLERGVQDIWPKIKTHTPLTHTGVRRRRRKDRAAVAQVTEQVTQMTTTLLQLQTALEQLDPALGGNSKRLYAELVLQAAIYERLEMLEDPIEFAMEHYELANTRILDAKTASNELWMEGAILAALVAEVLVMMSGFHDFFPLTSFFFR